MLDLSTRVDEIDNVNSSTEVESARLHLQSQADQVRSRDRDGRLAKRQPAIGRASDPKNRWPMLSSSSLSQGFLLSVFLRGRMAMAIYR